MKTFLDYVTCKWCSQRLNEVVPLEIPRKPDLILVGEAPGITEREQKRPFVGESGQLLRAIVRDSGARPIYINSRNTWGEDKPTNEAIKIERETHLLPLLASYPGIPVVAVGKYAAMALLGGQQNESKKAGEVLWLYNRPVLFTYHPAYYLYSHYDERVLEHIAIHIQSALRPVEKPKYFLNKFTNFLSAPEVIFDVETDSEDYPYYGSRIVVAGIKPIGGLPHIFTDDFLRKPNNLAKFNSLVSKPGQKVIGHGLMFDLVHAEHFGIDFSRCNFHDTFVFLKNLGVSELSLGLKFFAKRNKFPPYEGKFHSVLRAMGDVRKKKNEEEKAKAMHMIREMPLADLTDYNAYDLYVNENLYLQQKNETSPGLFAMDMDYMHYVKQMTANGLWVSKSKLDRRAAELQREKDKLEDKARKAYRLGRDFNFNSPPQVNSLITQLGIDLPDTNKQTLLDHFDEHPFIEELVSMRKVNKAIGKIKEIREHMTKNKTVHSKISVHGTETSRLTSKEPNIENMDVPFKAVIGSRYE